MAGGRAPAFAQLPGARTICAAAPFLSSRASPSLPRVRMRPFVTSGLRFDPAAAASAVARVRSCRPSQSFAAYNAIGVGRRPRASIQRNMQEDSVELGTQSSSCSTAPTSQYNAVLTNGFIFAVSGPIQTRPTTGAIRSSAWIARFRAGSTANCTFCSRTHIVIQHGGRAQIAPSTRRGTSIMTPTTPRRLQKRRAATGSSRPAEVSRPPEQPCQPSEPRPQVAPPSRTADRDHRHRTRASRRPLT